MLHILYTGESNDKNNVASSNRQEVSRTKQNPQRRNSFKIKQDIKPKKKVHSKNQEQKKINKPWQPFRSALFVGCNETAETSFHFSSSGWSVSVSWNISTTIRQIDLKCLYWWSLNNNLISLELLSFFFSSCATMRSMFFCFNHPSVQHHLVQAFPSSLFFFFPLNNN